MPSKKNTPGRERSRQATGERGEQKARKRLRLRVKEYEDVKGQFRRDMRRPGSLKRRIN